MNDLQTIIANLHEKRRDLVDRWRRTQSSRNRIEFQNDLLIVDHLLDQYEAELGTSQPREELATKIPRGRPRKEPTERTSTKRRGRPRKEPAERTSSRSRKPLIDSLSHINVKRGGYKQLVLHPLREGVTVVAIEAVTRANPDHPDAQRLAPWLRAHGIMRRALEADLIPALPQRLDPAKHQPQSRRLVAYTDDGDLIMVQVIALLPSSRTFYRTYFVTDGDTAFAIPPGLVDLYGLVKSKPSPQAPLFIVRHLLPSAWKQRIVDESDPLRQDWDRYLLDTLAQAQIGRGTYQCIALHPLPPDVTEAELARVGWENPSHPTAKRMASWLRAQCVLQRAVDSGLLPATKTQIGYNPVETVLRHVLFGYIDDGGLIMVQTVTRRQYATSAGSGERYTVTDGETLHPVLKHYVRLKSLAQANPSPLAPLQVFRSVLPSAWQVQIPPDPALEIWLPQTPKRGSP